MTEYILDVNKWRSGGERRQTKLGHGDTLMLNKEGFQCCLGQFASQRGVSDSHLMNQNEPAAVKSDVAYDSLFVQPAKARGPSPFVNTALANALIDINDSQILSIEERIDGIRKKLGAHGHTLRVINMDKLPPRYPAGGRIQAGDKIIVSTGGPIQTYEVVEFDSSQITIRTDNGEVTSVPVTHCYLIEGTEQ